MTEGSKNVRNPLRKAMQLSKAVQAAQKVRDLVIWYASKADRTRNVHADDGNMADL